MSTITDAASLMTTLESYFQADETLPVDAAAIRFHPELPTFTDSCIAISPASLATQIISIGVQEDTVGLNIFCVVRNEDPRQSVLDLFTLIEKVKKSLLEFGKAHPEDLVIMKDELTEPIEFTRRYDEDRKGFVLEYPVPYNVRLKEVYI